MGDAFVATREMRQDAPPCRIGQGRESPIQCLWRIFNHLVNYLAESLKCVNIFLEEPDLGVCFAGLPILKRIDNV